MNNMLVLLPIACGLLLAGGTLAWPIAYRAGLQAPERAEELAAARHMPVVPPDVENDNGYRPQHSLDAALGSATPRDRIRALRAPTEEFQAIVASSYRAGEFPLIGQPGMPYLKAHLAAVGP